MHFIDQYAYTNRIRTVAPVQKAGLTVTVLLLCLLLNRPLVGLMAIVWLWALATFWAGLPGRVFGRVLLAEGIFLALSVVGVAVSVNLAPPTEPGWAWPIGPVWVSSSPAAGQTALLLATRALGCAAALNFLALTTPLVDMVDLLRRLRLPPLLIDLMTLIYRFIFVLLESLERMHTAQASRLGYVGFRRGMVSAGLLASRLLIETYQRSQRLQVALEGRGYNGQLRVLPPVYRYDPPFSAWSVGVVISLLLGWSLV
jgi:cobalt/nickel transport system permease protein